MTAPVVVLSQSDFQHLVIYLPIMTAFALGLGWQLGDFFRSLLVYAARRISKRYRMHLRARVRRDWGRA